MSIAQLLSARRVTRTSLTTRSFVPEYKFRYNYPSVITKLLPLLLLLLLDK